MRASASHCAERIGKSKMSVIDPGAYPIWIGRLLIDSRTYWRRVTNSSLFTEIGNSTFVVERIRFSQIYFYPLIESFPRYLGAMLARVPAGNAKECVRARNWLIENLRVEARHASWWVDFARGFGVPASRFLNAITPPPEMDAISNYLWRVCTQATFAECFAAVNFAIEGPTGEWARSTHAAFRSYKNKAGTNFGPKTMLWLRAHAIYDDSHVHDALGLMALFAKTPAEQELAAAAAIRALKYYAMAVEACYRLSAQPDHDYGEKRAEMR
jgi:pyrroloquinoline quinone (PQQ) biosynthesis protein C